MQKVGIIGVGNAGGQTADQGKKDFGIDGVALNTSNDDISTIKNIDVICIGDEKGAGKDRTIAKQFLRDNMKKLLSMDVMLRVIEENNVIFIPGSTGGGSGSAIGPVLTHILSGYFPNKKFIPVGILPPLKESVAAQQNTIEYMKEIKQINPTFMLYDNEKRAHKTRSEMFHEVNREIVEDIAIIRGDYQYTTPYTSIDERDSWKILNTPGRLVVAKVSGFREKDIDDKSIEDRLIDSLKVSAHAELDRDMIIRKFGLITNLSEKIHKAFDPTMPKFKSILGEPVEEFEHIYINGVNDDVNRVIAIMSGLSIPDDRIEKIAQRIAEVEAQLTRTKETSLLDDVKTDLIKSLRQTETISKRISEDNLDDEFSKFM
jgi:regulator of extracellular matrix RemA (YlzA/DUF370 family)